MRLEDDPDGFAFRELERGHGLRRDVRGDDEVLMTGTDAHVNGDDLLATSEPGDGSGNDVTGGDAARFLDGEKDVSGADGDVDFGSGRRLRERAVDGDAMDVARHGSGGCIL